MGLLQGTQPFSPEPLTLMNPLGQEGGAGHNSSPGALFGSTVLVTL